MTGTPADLSISFSKYHSLAVDFILIADPDDRLAAVHKHALTSRTHGIGGTALLRVMAGTDGCDLAVDDDGSPYRNVWTSHAWDAALRCAAVFACDEGMVGGERLGVMMRSSGHAIGEARLRMGAGTLVSVEVGAPRFGSAESGVPESGPSWTTVAVPPGFDTDDPWWALAVEPGTLEVTALRLRGHRHAVVRSDDIERMFRYVGPEGCLLPGIGVGPAARLLRTAPPFAAVADWPVLDVLSVDSRDQITCGGAPALGNEDWPRGDGPCAAAAVARSAGLVGDRVYVPSGFGDLVVDCSPSPGEERPLISTAAVSKVFEGRVDLDALAGARSAQGEHLRALLA